MNLKELNSFKLSDAVTFHDKLNPKLWNSTKLRPEVREQLLVIAQDFLQELGVHDLDVKDITISGSNAAYSYTKHSDLDLHILVDMGNLPVDEVYRELFTAKKTIYNDTHDIKIHTIPVELYVQDSRQPVVSLGEYSVLNDQWIRIPTKRRSDFDQTATKSKYEKLLSLIEIALQSRKYSKVKHIIDTIKRYRQAGLDKGGEFGPENLAYKMLRSQGYITKLYDLRDKLHSEILTVETMYQNIDEESNHWYDAGVKDAQRDAKLYPDKVVKKLNPRTRLKTMQDKQARHPEEVEQYSLGYRSLKQGVAEAFNQPYSLQWEVGEFGDYNAYTKLPDGSNLSIMFNDDGIDDKAYSVEFWRNNSQEATGDGDSQRVFATVLHAIQEFLTKEQPNFISFIGAKGETGEGKNSRVNLYSKLLQRYATKWGYKLKDVFDSNDSVEFDLVKIKQGVAEDKENHNSKLDEILYKLCNIVKKEIKEKTGEHAVAACIIDPNNRIVAKTSKDKHGRWIHAERNAIDTYEKKYGEVPEGSIIVTTLSPCNEYDDRTSDERFGESCTDYINSKGIKKVYCGYMDPTQDNDTREFDIIETSDNNIQHECKKFADTFLKKNIDEAFDTPLPITWEKGMHGDVDALAKLPDGSNLSIMFNKQDNIKPDDKTWMVEFYRNNSQEVTGEGDAQKVFSTVLVAIQQFIKKYKPLKIYFSASKEIDPSINYGPDDVVPNPESRAKLYDRMVLRYAKSWGYKFFRADNGSSVIYQLSRIPKQKSVAEGLKEAAKSNAVTFFRGEPILSPDRLNQLKSSIGKPYPILRKEGSAANIGTYMSPDGKKATSFVQQALAGQGKGGAVTKIEVDPNSFQNGDGGIDEAVIITNIAGLVSDKDPDSKDPLRINDRKQAMLHYLGPGVRKYLNDPLLNNPEFVKRWYNPEFAQKNWNTIKSGKPAVTKPGESQIQEKMMNLLGPLTEKIRRDPEVINYFLTHNPGDWVEYNFRMNSDGSGTKVVDVKYYPPTKQGVGEDYTMQFAAEKTPPVSPYAGVKDNQYRGGISEASGYIPSEKQKNDPRFKTALTVDVHPDSIKKNAKAFYWNTSRAGIPPTAKANGKI